MGENDWMSLSDMSKLVKRTTPLGALRKYIFEKEINGATYWIRKMKTGRKLYVSPSRFYEWINNEGKIK